MSKTYGTLEGGREVVLTFDDGPHPRLTPKLLDCLAAEALKGVFFVVGTNVAARGGRDIVARAFAEGHRIGNHTFSHPDLTKLSEEKVREELTRTEELIAEFLTEHKLFRPPYGAHNSVVDRIVSELGYHVVLWSVDSQDWSPANKPTKWINIALNQIKTRGHSVFLCHDIHPTTVNNFPAFLNKVREIPKARVMAYV
jgi:peptidoglycan/xylan/chitin deacetylase (PgdA/CDA1 family)